MSISSTIGVKDKQEAVTQFAALLSSAVKVGQVGLQQPLRETSQLLPHQFDSRIELSTVCCTVPTFELHCQQSSFFCAGNKSILEETAALNLKRPRHVRKAELQELPVSILWKLSKSFMSLVDSRLKSTVAAILNTNRAGTGGLSTVLLANVLGSPSANPINPTSLVTTFRTLDLCTQSHDSITVPAIMEAAIDFNVMGTQEIVAIEAPAKFVGQFSSDGIGGSPRLLKLDLDVDTNVLLRSMMTRVREVVRSARTRAKAGIRELLPPSPTQAVFDSSHSLNDSQVEHSSNAFLSGLNKRVAISFSKAENDPPTKRTRLSGLSLLKEAAEGLR